MRAPNGTKQYSSAVLTKKILIKVDKKSLN